jgi:RNA polymerase sigma factor (sigma-70 family)
MPKISDEEFLLLNYEKLISSFAKKYGRPGVPCCEAEDIAQTAAIALLEAHRRYKPVAGAKFGTYAFGCMRGAILRYLKKNSFGVKISERAWREKKVGEISFCALEDAGLLS